MVTPKRLSIALTFLLLVLLLSACGTAYPETAADSDFAVAFPRVVIQIDEDGTPSVAGLTTETLKNLTLGNVDLTWLRMEPLLVKRFTDMDLQHIEAMYKDDGIFVFANGEAIPFINWSAESLGNTTALATELGGLDPTFASALTTILPLVQAIGMDVVVQFPVEEGADAVAMRALSDIPKAPAETPAPGGVQLTVEVAYDENGTPSVPGAGFILQSLMGVDLSQLALPPALIARLGDAGVCALTVSTQGDGLYLFVNDKALPRITWSQDQLTTGADILGELYFPNPDDPIRQVISTVLPVLNQADIALVLMFPNCE